MVSMIPWIGRPIRLRCVDLYGRSAHVSGFQVDYPTHGGVEIGPGRVSGRTVQSGERASHAIAQLRHATVSGEALTAGGTVGEPHVIRDGFAMHATPNRVRVYRLRRAGR